jgi:hypothetical protein
MSLIGDGNLAAAVNTLLFSFIKKNVGSLGCRRQKFVQLENCKPVDRFVENEKCYQEEGSEV